MTTQHHTPEPPEEQLALHPGEAARLANQLAQPGRGERHRYAGLAALVLAAVEYGDLDPAGVAHARELLEGGAAAGSELAGAWLAYVDAVSTQAGR